MPRYNFSENMIGVIEMSDELKPLINYEQFAAVDLRAGKILEASAHPNADKLVVLKVDLGPLGVRQVLAGIRAYYQPEELVGKTVIVVANLAPRMMRGLESQGMILAGVEGEPATHVVVSTLDKLVAPGSHVQ
jgi:methionine--tRNA ligase beta chain